MLEFRIRHCAGEPVLSPYFERYWLPILGPSGVVLMRHLVRTDPWPDGGLLVVDADALARLVGVGSAHLRRTLRRLVAMHLVRRNKGVYEVRSAVWLLDARQVSRLPAQLAGQHRAFTAAATSPAGAVPR